MAIIGCCIMARRSMARCGCVKGDRVGGRRKSIDLLLYGPRLKPSKLRAPVAALSAWRSSSWAGTLACHRQHAENWTFYEIDPEVVRIAQNPRLFRFMSECAPQARVILGDARLTLAGSPEH